MKNFFATNSGLTSTSANHIANMAKEAYQKLEIELENISFIRETISVIGSMTETDIKYANTALLNNAPKILEQICRYKSLIAYLREAIKEKEKLFEEAKSFRSAEYWTHYDNKPFKKSYITKEGVIEKWSIKDQEKYFTLETKCSVLGKFIHLNGPLNKAKKELFKKLNNPVNTECNGRDTIIRKYYPEASYEEVENLFFTLQKKYREFQAQLNGINHSIEMEIRENQHLVDEEYSIQLSDWNKKLSEIEIEEKLQRDSKIKEIEALKIIIPNDLKEVYEEINSLQFSLSHT